MKPARRKGTNTELAARRPATTTTVAARAIKAFVVGCTAGCTGGFATAVVVWR
jgi:hypothetical protein